MIINPKRYAHIANLAASLQQPSEAFKQWIHKKLHVRIVKEKLFDGRTKEKWIYEEEK